jgi:hypothetical protein
VYPGTKDYHEMMRDWKNRDQAEYVPKHKVRIIRDRFWLDFDHTEFSVKHPTLTTEALTKEVQESWRTFYGLPAIWGRTRSGPLNTLSFTGKIVYTIACLTFASLYPAGIAADNVRKTKLGLFAKLAIRATILMTRRTSDWFGIRPRRASVTVAKPRSPEPSTIPGAVSSEQG